MPNWCDNELCIYGSEEDLKKIKEQVTNEAGDFDFGKIIPEPTTPDYIKESISFEQMKENPLNWYEWRIENWGTKWNACESSVLEVENKTLRAWFQTAWSPSIPVTIALSKQYLNVRIEHKYIEEGNDYCGAIELRGGAELDGTWEDVPSHKSLELLGRECVCEYGDDPEYNYQDCPKQEVTING